MAGALGAIGTGSASVLTSCAGGGESAAANKPLKEPGTYYIPELPDKATDGKELKAGVSVLIVTKADAQGNRYILLSTTGSQKYNHVAKLVKQTAAATEEAAYPGTSTAVFGDTIVRGLSECQFSLKMISYVDYAF